MKLNIKRREKLCNRLPQSMVAELLILNRENSRRYDYNDAKLENMRETVLKASSIARNPEITEEFSFRAAEAAEFLGTTPPNFVFITFGDSLSSMYLETAGYSMLSVSSRMTGFDEKMKEFVVGHEISHKAHSDAFAKKAVFRSHEILAVFAGAGMVLLNLGGYNSALETVERLAAHPSFANGISVTHSLVFGAVAGFGIYLSRIPVSRIVDRKNELRADIDGVRFSNSAVAMVKVSIEEIDREKSVNTLNKVLRGRGSVAYEQVVRTGQQKGQLHFNVLGALQKTLKRMDSFIVKMDATIAKLYATHPSTERRIRNVLEYAARHGMEE